MNAENGRMFRSALSGYNKDDVNKYILDTDLKNRETLDKLNRDVEDMRKLNIALVDKNEQLEAKNAEQSIRIAELEAEIERLVAENKTQADSIQDITKKHDFYKAQTEAQNEVITRLRDEKASLNETVEVLSGESRSKDEQIKANAEKYAADIETLRAAYEAEMEQVKNAAKTDEGVAYKLDMYDKISSQIGDILINANRNSDEIISSAKREAEKILLKANEEAERLKSEWNAVAETRKAEAEVKSHNVQVGISTSANNALREIKEEFAGSMNNCVKEIQTCITEMQYETNALMSFLEQKQAEMNDRIEFYHSNVSDSVEEKLIALDSECSEIINSSSITK